MIDAEVMRHFVQDGAAHLIADAVGVAMTIGFDGLLEDGNVFHSTARDALLGERHALIESEQNMPFFHPDTLQRFLRRLLLHQHADILHLLLEFVRNAVQRFLDQYLEGAQGFVGAIIIQRSGVSAGLASLAEFLSARSPSRC